MQDKIIHKGKLFLSRSENILEANLCCSFFSTMADYEDTIKFLHPDEADYYNSLSSEKRKKSFLIGRFVAKQAIADLSGEVISPNILIQPGIFTQPVVVGNKQNIQVSITHCNDVGAALAFPEAHPMGIDIEKINPKHNDVLARQVTKTELKHINDWPLSYIEGLTLCWTVKEALSKVLKTGLTTPFEVFEIYKSELYNNSIISHYKNFSQYKAISFVIGGFICSLAYPAKTDLNFDLNLLQLKFALGIVERTYCGNYSFTVKSLADARDYPKR